MIQTTLQSDIIENGQQIAVIGSGISGLTAAHLLSLNHTVTLYEADTRLGGHTHTHEITREDGKWHVDTGFIVFNEKTYPNFIGLMKHLGITGRQSIMSFSVRNETTDFEYRATNLDTMFSQRKNILKPAMYRLLSEIFKFKKDASKFLDHPDPDITLGKLLELNRYSDFFRTHFILPMGAAIWSSSVETMMEFPALMFLRFFSNHGFLDVQNQPNWFTIPGGSSSYIPLLIKPFSKRIYLNSPVESIVRSEQQVMVHAAGQDPAIYDYVVVATHADVSLQIVDNLTDTEHSVLESFPYQHNKTILHTDSRLMPRQKKTWASWNYHISSGTHEPVSVSYNMNILQGLESQDDFVVTLNRSQGFNSDTILKSLDYEHPVFTKDSLSAQARHQEINGTQRTFYCGAYWRNGFHEDGVVSALAVCKRFGLGLEDLK